VEMVDHGFRAVVGAFARVYGSNVLL
jgi:hypothetical protein